MPFLGKLADKENGTPAYEVLETCTGKDLEYKEYEPLFDCAGGDLRETAQEKAYFVTCADYVYPDRRYRRGTHCTGFW